MKNMVAPHRVTLLLLLQLGFILGMLGNVKLKQEGFLTRRRRRIRRMLLLLFKAKELKNQAQAPPPSTLCLEQLSQKDLYMVNLSLIFLDSFQKKKIGIKENN